MNTKLTILHANLVVQRRELLDSNPTYLLKHASSDYRKAVDHALFIIDTARLGLAEILETEQRQ